MNNHCHDNSKQQLAILCNHDSQYTSTDQHPPPPPPPPPPPHHTHTHTHTHHHHHHHTHTHTHTPTPPNKNRTIAMTAVVWKICFHRYKCYLFFAVINPGSSKLFDKRRWLDNMLSPSYPFDMEDTPHHSHNWRLNDSCARSMYQGQVSTSRNICEMQLLVFALDSCLWHTSPQLACCKNYVIPGWRLLKQRMTGNQC